MQEDIVQQIKDKLDIVALISEYTTPIKAGRNFKALCPFHKEKTPSFMISPEKQIGYCFGCQKGGDIFAIVQEMEHIGFPEAVEYLAEKTGVEYTRAKVKHIHKEEKQNYYDILKDAVEYFETKLESHSVSIRYLKERGLTKETMTRFHIGYAEDSYDALWKTFRDKGYETKDLFTVGLLGGDSKKYYDKFRKRIIFPIFNVTGHPVGFGGRILGEGQPKYLNTADTPIYDKSSVLFGLNLAKESIKEQDAAIVVEGYMDVITAYQNGIHNVVATSGTALTKQQLRLLKRYTENIHFLFDNDKAGFEATIRNGEVALSEEVNLYVLSLPNDSKDIDEYFQKHPTNGFESILSTKMLFFQYVIEKVSAKHDITSIEGKKLTIRALLPLLKRVTNEVEKEHYLGLLSKTINVSQDALQKELTKVKLPKIQEHISAQTPDAVRYGGTESMIIALLVQHPHLMDVFSSFLEEDFFSSEFENTIYKHLSRDYTFGDTGEASLWDLLNEDQQKRLHMILFYVEKEYTLPTEEDVKSLLRTKIRQLYTIQKKHILNAMKKHEETKDPLKWKQTFDHLRTLQEKEEQLLS